MYKMELRYNISMLHCEKVPRDSADNHIYCTLKKTKTDLKLKQAVNLSAIQLLPINCLSQFSKYQTLWYI